MLFSSITFLYYFLPIVLIVYFLTPKKGKNLVLMIASFIFYGWGEPVYLLFMLLSVGVHYVLALLIERHQGGKLAKFWLILAVTFSLALLGYFKYADFFIQNFNAVTGMSLPLLKVALPIGISFYTFQIMSYTIDVYRQDTPAQRSIIKLATYVSMFPQLIAGPIVRYVDVAAGLDEREHSFAKVRSGLRRFMVGRGRLVFNILLVWLLTGFWHGAAWNFIVWGLIFAVLLLVEKLWLSSFLEKIPAWIRHVLVLLVVVVSFVVFDAPNLALAGQRIGAMFGAGKLPWADTVTYYYLRSYGLILILAAVCSTPLIKMAFEKLRARAEAEKALSVAEPLVSILLLLVITGYLVDSSFNPFLYFRF
ncbi:MAG: hypothetical protein GX681_08815 [Clostridiaceae bacterium]|nr:hypothetical protein [Clostridiaceae bacterium]